MTSSNQDWVVEPGTDVYGSDGEKVGEVDTIEGGFLVIRKGFFFPKDHQIPFAAIAGHTNDRIDLNVTADEAKNEQWVTTTATTGGTATGYNTTTDLDTDVNATAPRGGDVVTRDEAPIEHVNRGASHEHDADHISVPVVEEELTAQTRGVERGQVHVETRVSEREETLQVPVTEERVHVDRVAVNRAATSEDMSRDGRDHRCPGLWRRSRDGQAGPRRRGGPDLQGCRPGDPHRQRHRPTGRRRGRRRYRQRCGSPAQLIVKRLMPVDAVVVAVSTGTRLPSALPR